VTWMQWPASYCFQNFFHINHLSRDKNTSYLKALFTGLKYVCYLTAVQKCNLCHHLEKLTICDFSLRQPSVPLAHIIVLMDSVKLHSRLYNVK
jgi:hypothetical protein